MIPMKSVFVLVAVCGALAGCTSAGQLTPTASAAINTAYNDICNALPAVGPVSATMNADAKNAYAQAQTICAAGAPTNAVAAGVDILAIENALLPYFKKATAEVNAGTVFSSKPERALKRLPFDYGRLVETDVLKK
jgi:hypothetical protein